MLRVLDVLLPRGEWTRHDVALLRLAHVSLNAVPHRHVQFTLLAHFLEHFMFVGTLRIFECEFSFALAVVSTNWLLTI